MTDGQKFTVFIVGLSLAGVFSLTAEGFALYTLLLDDGATAEAQKTAWAIFPSVLSGWFGLMAGWKFS